MGQSQPGSRQGEFLSCDIPRNALMIWIVAAWCEAETQSRGAMLELNGLLFMRAKQYV